MSERVRVLLVDDHRIVRRGLARLLAAEGDIEVVGEAADGVEALELLADTAPEGLPDVALVDVHMPRMEGTELVRRLAVEYPGTAAVVLTGLAEDEHLLACLSAGARGYLLKDAEPEEVAESVRRAARGESVLFGHAAERLIATLAPPPSAPSAGPEAALSPPGSTNREIARTLHLSEGTVRNHVTNILRKLDLRDRTALALWYAERS
ncbi:response regulator [Nocardiopsis alba]|uniref:Bacterial regulatory s, luxR family protein n=1 Tax=Nocardiopsis alba (strain ATCC BAA-2165 / BE74) TaxID=1205910 RepID=J7LEF3_NOCAA|nr:response regulator transcription factor [Nocardiopsis alba]AFR09815.1 bacterial regulatory s, luxR family protein [Nocardiopsis alba ATCC BAA-2165]